jgi:hypothetical protein
MRRSAFAAVFLVLFTASGLAAQASQPGATAGKGQPTVLDATVARNYAAKCWGCGHLYAGEYGKGGLLLGVGLVSLVAAPFTLTASEDSNCYNTEYGRGCDTGAKINWVPALTLVGISVASYIYGIVDAGPSAGRMNAKNGFKVASSLRLEPTVTTSANATNVGLRFTRTR